MLLGYTLVMQSDGTLLDLLGKIYDAASEPSLWPVFLERFSDVAGGTTTALVHHDMSNLRATMAVFVRASPECHAQYFRYYSAIDELRKGWLRHFSHATPDGVATSEEVTDAVELRHSEYFNDFQVPHKIEHQFCGPIEVGTRRASVVSCSRSAAKGPFGADQIALLRLLLPHLQRAMRIHRRMAVLEANQRGSLDALDLMSVGIVLLSRRGRILYSNRLALQILAQSDGLLADRHGLVAASSSSGQKLRRAIATACDSQLEMSPSEDVLAVERPSGKRPFTIFVTPVSRRLFEREASGVVAAVFVADPEMIDSTPVELLMRWYGLSEKEAVVARHLMHGETLAQAAQSLEITHNTARTHLQRIFNKTATHHQGELIRLLMSSRMIPIRR